jgi:malonyl-CoA decarboxylase
MNIARTILNDLALRISEVGRGLISTPQESALTTLCEGLLSGQGEATGLATACVIFDRYAQLSNDKKQAFFLALKDQFGVDKARFAKALETWQAGDGRGMRHLHTASEPRSQELIRRLNRAPGGTRRLVAMRQDLLTFMADDPSLQVLDDDFRHLFGSWFNRGFLELRRIDWSTPAAILETIIKYEAVHEITGWDDLRRRVAAPDRRLYAFFHPALADDPLIFVEVALSKGIPGNIGAILAADRAMLNPAKAQTAVFYSISNCQEGLRGVSFGNFLIKQVVEELRREFAGLTNFVTLSPVPGLRRWATAQQAAGTLPDRFAKALQATETTPDTPPDGLAELTAHYLLVARAKNGAATDPVARFHLGNGARLEIIHLNADVSPRGQAASWGVMVNYLYDLATIERNHEAYTTTGEIIAAPAVHKLLKSS